MGSFYVIESEDPAKFSCGFFAKKSMFNLIQIWRRMRDSEAAGIVLT